MGIGSIRCILYAAGDPYGEIRRRCGTCEDLRSHYQRRQYSGAGYSGILQSIAEGTAVPWIGCARYEMEGDPKNYDYENESLGNLGYQKQEFDNDSGELVNADADFEDDELELELDDESEFADAYDE